MILKKLNGAMCCYMSCTREIEWRLDGTMIRLIPSPADLNIIFDTTLMSCTMLFIKRDGLDCLLAVKNGKLSVSTN